VFSCCCLRPWYEPFHPLQDPHHGGLILAAIPGDFRAVLRFEFPRPATFRRDISDGMPASVSGPAFSTFALPIPATLGMLRVLPKISPRQLLWTSSGKFGWQWPLAVGRQHRWHKARKRNVFRSTSFHWLTRQLCQSECHPEREGDHDYSPSPMPGAHSG
jgi:hypothetical protein